MKYPIIFFFLRLGENEIEVVVLIHPVLMSFLLNLVIEKCGRDTAKGQFFRDVG